MFRRQGWLDVRFWACFTTFHVPSGDAHLASLDLRYAFFLAFAITRLFSARASRKSSELSSVFSFFQIFLSLLAFICISLHPSSNFCTYFGDNLALGIARVIAVSIALIKECTLLSISSSVVDVQEESLTSSSLSVFVNAGICILIRRSCELNWLSIVRIVYLDTISWWSES